MNKNVLVLCASYQDALAAYNAGIKNIELCMAPSLHALTPTLGNLTLVKKNIDVNVMCTLRQRAGGFHYDELDVEAMFTDAKILLENGADGLVFGFINNDLTVDVENTKKMIELIHSCNKKAIFNRGIDVCKDIYKEVEVLVSLGIDSLITSGGYIEAVEGINVIKKLNDLYGNQIEIMAGCGINETNAQYILDNTGISKLHYSKRSTKKDATTSRFGVNFSYVGSSRYEVVDTEEVIILLNSLR